MLPADIYKESHEFEELLNTLMLAKNLQMKLLDRMRTSLESPEMLENQKAVQCKVCCRIAEYHEEQKNDEAAIQAYKEALRAQATNEACMLSLCKLHYRLDDLDACRAQCEVLTRINKDNEEAAILI